MLEITRNPLQRGGAGGYLLSGTVTAVDFTITWWWADNPSLTYTKYVETDGINWELVLPLGSATDVVQIVAEKDGESSNILTINLAANNQQPEPTFQFNEFDEMAVDADMERLPLETNEEFRQRTMATYTRPGSSTKLGLVEGIERQLALPSLRNFFYLSTRFDPRTSDVYDRVHVSFGHYSCSVQLPGWINTNELVDLDPSSWEFTTHAPIGNENFENDNVVKIYNGEQPISNRSFKQTGDNTIWLDLNDNRIDATKKLTVTYPYRKSFSYVNEDNTLKTVNQVRDFLEQVATVQDENGFTKPLIVWNNGTFEPLTEEPTTFNTFQSIEQAINDQPYESVVKNVKIANDTNQYYTYVDNFVSKGFFSATQILPELSLDLTKDPYPMNGSWVKIDPFHSEEFTKRLETPGQDVNKRLEYYAHALREFTRMGIPNTVVNKDEWGSDKPEHIGSNFIPSRFDGGIQDFTMLSSDGTYKNVSINERRHLIKVIASQS